MSSFRGQMSTGSRSVGCTVLPILVHACKSYLLLSPEGGHGLARSTRGPLAARLTTVKTQWPRTEPLASASRFLLLHVAFTWYAARKDSAMCNQSTVLLLLLSCTLYMSR